MSTCGASHPAWEHLTCTEPTGHARAHRDTVGPTVTWAQSIAGEDPLPLHDGFNPPARPEGQRPARVVQSVPGQAARLRAQVRRRDAPGGDAR